MKILKYAVFLFCFIPFLGVSAQIIKEYSANFPKTLVLEGTILQHNRQLIIENDTKKKRSSPKPSF